MELKGLLELLFTKKASDLHMRVGSVPVLRIDGNLFGTRPEPVTEREMNALLDETLTTGQLDRFMREKELDLALTVPGHGRVRVNVYFQKGTPALALRAIKTAIPSFKELGLPPAIEKMCGSKRGIILLTGATGSGKSTTMAAMVEHINQTRSVNILTIEDPIEYVFSNKKSLIAQREVMIDTDSFLAALTHALREDPDIIMVGEIRDQTTMKIALQAAETGHLVLTSLHTLNAVEAVNRIISFFPLNEQAQVRTMLAGSLQAVISQRLVSKKESKGRVPLVEIMINTAAVRECLAQQDKMHVIHGLIEDDKGTYGMQSFDQSILGLFNQGIISYETAIENANNPNDLEMAVRGIKSSASRLAEI